jgi:hypothetical protein
MAVGYTRVVPLHAIYIAESSPLSPMSFLHFHLHLHRCLLESTCPSAAAICAISTENRKPHFAGRVMLCALKSMIETDCTV